MDIVVETVSHRLVTFPLGWHTLALVQRTLATFREGAVAERFPLVMCFTAFTSARQPLLTIKVALLQRLVENAAHAVRHRHVV